jgi:outer membrane lipoprotein carrier protein
LIPRLAFIVAFPILSAAPRPDAVADAVAGLERRYAGVRALRAQFTQSYRAPGVEQVESGVVYMRRPALMRWEYRQPETKLFVADGRNAYLYVPEERQVTVRPFGARDLHDTPLEILLGGGGIDRTFHAAREMEVKPRAEGTLLVRLTPRAPQPEYEFVVVEIDARTFDLVRLVIRDGTGGTSEFTFSGLAADVKLEERLFRFTIPKGVEVIRMDDRE